MDLADQINKAKAAAAEAVKTAGASATGADGAVVAGAATTSNLLATTSVEKPVAAKPVAGAGPPLGGGDRLALVMDALKTAKVGGGRNDMPLGTGICLLKSGKFFVTDDGKWKITAFSFLCMLGIKDVNDLVFGAEGYTGPRPGETYDFALFQDFSPKKIKKSMGDNLNALRVCMGWSKEQVKEYQTTPDGMQTLMELLKGMLCADMGTCEPTNEPSIFSNQVVLQLSRKPSIVPDKNKEGKPVYLDNQGTVSTTTYENDYWDKKIPLAELVTLVGDDAKVIEAFGSAEAFKKALANEQALAEAFK